jgi:hypothetical protein
VKQQLVLKLRNLDHVGLNADRGCDPLSLGKDADSIPTVLNRPAEVNVAVRLAPNRRIKLFCIPSNVVC